MKLEEIKDPKLRQRILDSLAGVDAMKNSLREICPAPPLKKKRIQQRTKPSLNKLEREALDWLEAENKRARSGFVFRPHSLTLFLANGCKFTPDIIGIDPNTKPRIMAWEVKGKHAWDDAIVKLKVAAHEWPNIEFYLLWKEIGQWCSQHILP